MAETAVSFNVFYMYACVSVSYDDRFVKIWATCEKFFGQMVHRRAPPPPPPPWQKIARTPMPTNVVIIYYNYGHKSMEKKKATKRG